MNSLPGAGFSVGSFSPLLPPPLPLSLSLSLPLLTPDSIHHKFRIPTSGIPALGYRKWQLSGITT